MATTLEDLEKRVAALEQAVVRWRRPPEMPSAQETPVERVERLLQGFFADQATISATVAKAFAEMGIQGQAIGAETVQEMIAACGVKPEDNEFSRGIVAMREE